MLGTHCPGLRVEQVLHHDNKSVLAAGYIGDEPVVIKMPAEADPLWRLRQRHEIGVYLIFAEHPPPVRVPRLVHTDGESIVISALQPGATTASTTGTTANPLQPQQQQRRGPGGPF